VAAHPFSLAPGFSRVWRVAKLTNRFLGFSRPCKEAAEAAEFPAARHTRLTPGANENRTAGEPLGASASRQRRRVHFESHSARTGFLIFFLATIFATRAPAADVAAYGILKIQQFLQTGDALPATLATSGFAFDAFVIGTSPGAVTNATIKPSNATPLRTLAPLADGLAWRFEERFDFSAALDATYPNGSLFGPVSYALAMNTVNDGSRTVNLALTTFGIFAGYPPAVQITNFAAAQSIDTTADFVLGWSISGAQSIDLLQVSILDASSNIVFASPAPFAPGALSSSSTSFFIPANSLPPGTNLFGHITLARPLTIPNTNSYPGAIGVSAAVRDTQFSIVTRPAPAPPRVQLISAGNSGVRIDFPAEANRLYRLQRSFDLRTWLDLPNTNSPGGTIELSDPSSATNTRAYYRVRIGQ
jgi:hypothetical protein